MFPVDDVLCSLNDAQCSLNDAGVALLAHWESLHLSTVGIRRVPSGATPVVAAIFDHKGDLAQCIADVEVRTPS
jgi:hypothetical protein